MMRVVEFESPREAAASSDGAAAIRIPGGNWSIWTTAALRGAGFHAALVLDLSGARAAAAADEYMAADADVGRRTADVEAQLRSGTADVATRTAHRARRRRVVTDAATREGSDAQRALATAMGRRASAHEALLAAYAADTIAADERIREIAHDPRFCEAALWQNHRAIGIVMRRVREGHGSPKDRRNAAALLVKYLQRYCVKNDTIGFFGPVGWASLVDRPEAVDVVPGPALVASREVRFEGWCLDALATALNADPAVRPWAAPRRKAGVWIGPGEVYAPIVGRVHVTPAERLVLIACDGTRTATEVARALVGVPSSAFQSEADVVTVYERLVARGLLVWQMDVAPQLHGERELARRIDHIGDPEVQAVCRQALDSIVEARDAVAAAAGNPGELALRLEELDRTFTAVTGQSPARRAGHTYGARGLVYEDCRRACDVTLGRSFLDRLGPPLSIVLDAARWASAELAAEFNGYLRQCFAKLRVHARGGTLDGHLFYAFVRAKAADLTSISEEVVRRCQDRWRSVLDFRDERRCVYAVEEVAARSAAAFATAGAAWSRARYISPDVLVAARGLDAFRRGEFHCVLGEVHGTNTLAWSMFLAQHPNADAMIATLTEESRGQTVVVTQTPKDLWLARMDLTAIPPTCWRYEWGDGLPVPVECRSIPAASLAALDDGRCVRVRARDGSLGFDALELFGDLLCVELHGILAQWLPCAPHTPRVTIGDLTIAREQWRVPAAALGDLDAATQFARIRAWARSQGMPRHVFFKAPNERKPYYLDFESPVFVKLFAKVMRQLEPGTWVRVAEMLPRPDETWLVDIDGRTYTSELRFVTRPCGRQS